MGPIKTYQDYLYEAGEEGKEGGAAPKAETVEVPESGAMKDFEINGKKYKGVLSTFKSVSTKQVSMGYESVGIISLPGEKNVYELFEDKGKKEEKK